MQKNARDNAIITTKGGNVKVNVTIKGIEGFWELYYKMDNNVACHKVRKLTWDIDNNPIDELVWEKQ